MPMCFFDLIMIQLYAPGLTKAHGPHAGKEERFRAGFIIMTPDPLQPSFLLFQARN